MPLLMRRSAGQLVLLVTCAWVLHNEYLVHVWAAVSWPALTCGDLTSLHTVLLVADPQILGEQSENWLARWDNDRYLSKSFGSALRRVSPELIVFLGDLMDEGSLATDQQYLRYYARFRQIFQLDHIPANKTLFVPGDNDIGGEDELVTESKVSRFHKHFHSPRSLSLGHIHFVQVDKMQRIVPTLLSSDTSNRTTVVLSHMPLLGMPSAFAQEVVQKLRPQLILSAHEHKSLHFSADADTDERTLVVQKLRPQLILSAHEHKSLHFSADADTYERTLVEALITNQHASQSSSWRFQWSSHIINEVVVPTCSYRMGVPDMGFGVALLDDRGEAWCYHVLWLPSRFSALLSYVALLILLILLQCCVLPCRRQRLISQLKTY